MHTRRSGQWIILSGIMLAIGLVSLTTLLNESISAGYKVALSETDLAVHEMNEIYEETVRAAKLAWSSTNKNEQKFNKIMENFGDEISEIYALRGLFVSMDVSVHDASSNIANLTIQMRDERMNFTLGPDRKIPLI